MFHFLLLTVPRKVLIDRFESTPEPDEPLQFDDLEIEQEELYDEDQFYKEQDISPGPAPKLQGDLVKKNHREETPVYTVTSSVSPPQRNRDDSSLQGEWQWRKIISINHSQKLTQTNREKHIKANYKF
jgi:hypothetical protein